ncbi:ABC transporter permease [Catenovulum sediminis]|uniref:ABC transporter permease n=1 Tax=Catenovulum sediminis TaxID=1740262 RepID=A0ABV1RC03_9ALTE|nr:ABC transporter permease [Catenovulum sediminis]
MIKAVYQKEMLELIRDKKTLVFMILLPLLIFPAIFGALAVFAAKTVKAEQEKTLTYFVSGAEADNPILEKLAAQNNLQAYQAESLGNATQLQDADIKKLIQDGKLDFWLQINDHFSVNAQSTQQNTWYLYFNNASGINSASYRIDHLIREFNQSLTQSKLISFGVDKNQIDGILQPVVLQKQDIAPEKESLGSKLGGLVAYILLPLCLLGAIYPAIDLAAGEKERGTLESLMIAPVKRIDLVLGKFFTIFTASFIAALSAIVSLALWSFIFAQGLAVEIIVKIVGTLGVSDLMLALFMMLPVVLLVSAMVLCISIYAKNFKEAQNFMAPLSFFIFVPLIVAMLPGIDLNWQWALVPISNVALSIKDILKGQADGFLLSIVWGSQFLLACIMLSFCVYWFSQEKVLFR